jgi:hypothetical protein
LDQPVETRAGRGATWLLVVWSVGLGVLLLGPALGRGYVLGYDMVWVPQLTLRADFLGFATSLPRVVPSDAVVAVLDSVVPGMALQKIVLLGSLVAGGLGMLRLVRDLPLVGRLATVTSYQWSPIVVERLLIGHWPVLVGWACLPWVLELGRRWRSTGAVPALLPLVLVVGSLSASAGIMTAVALVLAGARRGVRRWAAIGGLALAANAPWLLAGLLHAGSARSADAGGATFALQAEGGVPAPVAALSLGGIWNGDVVPGSRTGLAGWLAAVIVVVLAFLGRGWWRSVRDGRSGRAVLGCWAVGMAFALLTWAAPNAVGWLAAHVPGGGVLRDGARMLVLAAPAAAVAVGAGASAVAAAVDPGAGRRFAGAGLVVLPVLLLADATWGVGGRLAAVSYPAGYDLMRAAVSAGPPGDVLVLPLSSFRRPAWNGSRTVLDPVGRYQPRDYVSSDVLVVSGTTIPGEDPRVAEARAALAEPTGASRAAALSALGIGLVVTDRTAPGDAPEVAGRPLTPADADLGVVALPGQARPRRIPATWYAVLGAAWAAYGTTGVLLPPALALLRRHRRRRRRDQPAAADRRG